MGGSRRRRAPRPAGRTGAYRRLGILPFDHERQLVSVTAADPSGATVLVTKGAPEAVLARCAGVPDAAAAVLERLFGEGARVVAVATRAAAGAGRAAAGGRAGPASSSASSRSPTRPKADAGASIAKLARSGSR